MDLTQRAELGDHKPGVPILVRLSSRMTTRQARTPSRVRPMVAVRVGTIPSCLDSSDACTRGAMSLVVAWKCVCVMSVTGRLGMTEDRPTYHLACMLVRGPYWRTSGPHGPYWCTSGSDNPYWCTSGPHGSNSTKVDAARAPGG